MTQSRHAAGAGIAFAAYAALFALLASPWLVAATRAVPIALDSGRDDARLVTWILWWVAKSLVHDPLGVFAAPINYPAPNQLAGSEHFATTQAIFFPSYYLTGNPVLALNAVLFLLYPLAAWLMYRLARALDFDPLVAWIAGLLLALGALQVPAQVYMLQTAAIYPPAIALALHRLRERPDLRRAGLLAGVLIAAFFTAFYTVAVSLPIVLVWGAAEAVRPLALQRRFVALVATVVALAIVVLAAASLPYLSRAGGSAMIGDASLPLLDVLRLFAEARTFGAVCLVLALGGCAAVLDGTLRRYALAGLALVAISIFLMSPLPGRLVEMLPPSRLRKLFALPLDFFRVRIRYQMLTNFGLVLLAVCGLQLLRNRLPGRAGIVVLAVCALALTVERGRILLAQPLDVSPAHTSDAQLYREIARVTAEQGRGPLLTLPLWSFGASQQPEAMMGSIVHELPLIAGHTGYLPPHRLIVDQTIRRLPSGAALQDLVDMTHLRWILLQPAPSWGAGDVRDRFLRDMLRLPGVRQAWSANGWTLLAVLRPHLHDEWFAAIAAGQASGRSILGTPIAAFDVAGLRSRLILTGAKGRRPGSLDVSPGGRVELRLTVANEGAAPWAIALPPNAETPVLHLLSRWKAVDGMSRESAAAPHPASHRLPRDVPSGESVSFEFAVTAPTVPGRYALALCLAFAVDSCLTGPADVPSELVVDVVPSELPRAPTSAS